MVTFKMVTAKPDQISFDSCILVVVMYAHLVS